MRKFVPIWYFYDKRKAEKASKVIVDEGFDCKIGEDIFNGQTFDKYGMHRRFKILVDPEEIEKIAQILAKRLKTR